jgi:hypothetical protein
MSIRVFGGLECDDRAHAREGNVGPCPYRQGNMSYLVEQRLCARSWKVHTNALPVAAQLPAEYVDKNGLTDGHLREYCLPPGLATHNLLPDVRDRALALFSELGIPWHAGIDPGPSNHLLSSQVQCANALTLMVTDPSRIVRAFGDVIGIGEVLQIEPGRWLTFEYIGPVDFFGEAPDRKRVRGSRCTSVDAAFLHRAPDGARELVLVEWKYTESYRVRRADPVRDAVRRRRYEAAITDPDGPVRADLLAFEYLLDEPFYQLVRQQLLAHALEQSGVADRVRVAHVLPPGNHEYQRSLARPEHRALGDTVSQVWQQLLRWPDRFTTMDPEAFLTPLVTSDEYVLRYAPDVVWGQLALLSMLGAEDAEDVAAALDWDEYVELETGAVMLRVETRGTGLRYPFRLGELYDLARELEG